MDQDGVDVGHTCHEPHLELECHARCRNNGPPIKIEVRVSLLVEAFMDALQHNHDRVVLLPAGRFVTRSGPLPVKGPGAYPLRRSGTRGLATPST
jgi:hypothetical protein